jgi:hypothetical protein
MTSTPASLQETPARSAGSGEDPVRSAVSGPSVGRAPAEWGRWWPALHGRPGLAAGFLWGFAEAVFFFVIPDVLLSLVTLFSVRQGLKQLAAILAGALVGGAAVFVLAWWDAGTVEGLLHHVPLIPEGMFRQARQDLEEDGVWGTLHGPDLGIPYKVYAAQAPAYASLPAFLLASVPARVGRFAFVWLVCAACRRLLRRRIDAHPRVTLAAYAACWALFYVWYATDVVPQFSP